MRNGGYGGLQEKSVNARASIIPENEGERLAAVRRYDILDTPADGAFDRITSLAARRFQVPISIVSIVDEDRIWFKSHHGVPVNQIGRDPGLCASAILSSDPHILTDAKVDPRSLANPLVAGEFGLRFYAGVPLQTSDGHNLGTLCIIDKVPRPIDQGQIDDLKDLASVVMDQMELRLSAKRAIGQAELMAREIDHRVMNSLQFVSALLSMHSRLPDAAQASHQLKQAANRVTAVARVHRHFYSDAAEEVSGTNFIRRLCADLSTILERPVDVDGDDSQVPTTSIQPIGLIVNELVTNAAKHGRGRIRVTFNGTPRGRELIVCDQGDGLPVGFDPEQNSGSLGMKVVLALARQLGGRLTGGANPIGAGACLKVTFPANS
jgi:two-component sensor histidine kinase